MQEGYFIPPFFIYLVLSSHYDLELGVREKQACVRASEILGDVHDVATELVHAAVIEGPVRKRGRVYTPSAIST